jgi:hypothetical protein
MPSCGIVRQPGVGDFVPGNFQKVNKFEAIAKIKLMVANKVLPRSTFGFPGNQPRQFCPLFGFRLPSLAFFLNKLTGK